MRIIRGKPLGVAIRVAEWTIWWLPEVGVTAGLATAAAVVWWPLGVAAVVPALRPARDALVQVAYARQARELAAAPDDVESDDPAPAPVPAVAARLDQVREIEAGGGDQQ
jgi:hypothetical protein